MDRGNPNKWEGVTGIDFYFCFRYFTRKILRFFGVDPGWEEESRQLWTERRRRLAIKKLGGVKVQMDR